MNTDLVMLLMLAIILFFLLIFFVLCKKKNYNGKVTVYIDEDYDYKATISFDDLKEAMARGEGLFQVETIYIME